MTAFDGSLELPYLAWPPDLSTRAMLLADEVPPAEAERVVRDGQVRLLVVDDRSAVAVAARADERFVEIHRCKPRPPPKCLESETSLPRPFTQQSTCVIFFRR
jgi:hypothetical protein